MKDAINQYSGQNLIEVEEETDVSLSLIYREITGSSYRCYSPDKIDHFVLVLFEGGGGTNTIDSAVYSIAPFQMQLCLPGQALYCKLESSTIIHEISVPLRVFNIVSSNFGYSLSLNKKYPTVTLNAEIFYKLTHELKCISGIIKPKNELIDILHFRLRIILLMISRELLKVLPQHPGKSRRVPLLERFLDLVVEHCQDARNVKFYADRLFVSSNYLNILCQKHYKRTASSIINDELIRIIKRRLCSDKKAISAISTDLKFCDTASFSTFFRKHTGMSPRMFRNKHESG